MVEISEIVDGDSLMEWLNQQPDVKAASVFIAHRAAMRVLPVVWEWLENATGNGNLTGLPILRQSLTSSVVCYAGKPEVLDAAAAAVARVQFGAIADLAAARASRAASAAFSAFAAADPIASGPAISGNARSSIATRPDIVASIQRDAYFKNAASSVKEAVRAAPVADIWGAVRADCKSVSVGVDMATTQLWPQVDFEADQTWKSLKSDLRSRSQGTEATARGAPDIDWSFWIDWYERALTGTETRWDMLTEIGLLDSKIWEGDPSVLMDEIYSIQARHSAKATPFAERISFNEDTQKWRADPESGLPDDRAVDVLDKIRDAVDLLPETDEANSPYAEVREDSARMVQRVERYADRGQPAMIHDTIHSTLALIQKRADDGQCPSFEADPLLAQLRDDLLGAAQDLYLFDEKVRHVVDTRNHDKAAAAPSEIRSAIARSAEQIAPLAEGSLAEDLKDDALILLGGFATPLEMAQALYRISSRISRIMLVAGKRLRAIHKETAAVATDTAKIIVGFELARNASVWIAKIFP